MARLLWLAKPRHDQSQGCNNSLLMLPAEDRWILVTNSSACDLAINLRGIHLLDDLGCFGKFFSFQGIDDSISKLRIKMRKQNCLRNICPKSVDFFGGMCIRRWNPFFIDLNSFYKYTFASRTESHLWWSNFRFGKIIFRIWRRKAF